MDTHTLLLFSATVVPLVCTPGPDMLFIVSQAISGGVRAGLRSALGVCLGYLVHSSLVTLGLAAVIAASPILFEVIRWVGITYLVYLAYKLIRSALSAESIAASRQNVKDEVSKGFLTSLLNPKGMMIYVAILPQFMDKQSSISMQAAILSAIFIFWCTLVYSAVCILLSVVGLKGGFSDERRRLVNGGAGGLILLAAGFMMTA